MSNRAKTSLLLIGDVFFLLLAIVCTIFFRKGPSVEASYLFSHFKLFTYIFPIWILIFFIEGLYTLKTYNFANLQISIFRSVFLSLAFSFVIIYLLPSNLTDLAPKTNLVIIAIFSIIFLYTWRNWFLKFFSNEKRNRGVLLIGSSITTNLVTSEVTKKPYLGYKVVKCLTAEETGENLDLSGVELIAIERVAVKESLSTQKIFNLLGSVEIIDLAKFAENISGKIPISSIDETWFIDYCGYNESRSYNFIKMLIDRTTALTLLIVLLPFIIIFIPILLVFHGRPIFFKQVRTGLNNKPFKLYKLRSMVVNAEKDGIQWAVPGDARITRIGKFLRKSRIDELPQLINILRGEMSLVGPRPERPEIIKSNLSLNIPFYDLRHLVKPGVTGWAQVTFRYGYSTEDSLEKLQYDLYYVKNRSIWLDVLIILKTIKTILTGAGQ